MGIVAAVAAAAIIAALHLGSAQPASGVTGSGPAGHGSGPPVATLDRSPILGVSFHQNGQLATMSSSGSTETIAGSAIDTINVSMRDEPFEFWFPALEGNSWLAVCASPNPAIFNPGNATTCLSPGRTALDYKYGEGGFWVTSDPADPINTGVGASRAEPAANGDQKFYVGNLVRYSGSKFYIAICRNDGGLTLKIHNNLEFFVLNFS
jgi:hypothetical protein